MAFTALLDYRTIVALLSGLAIGLALGLSAGSSRVLEHRLSEEQAKADAVFGNQPASFWIQQLKDRDPTLRQQALRALAHLGPKQEGVLQAVTEMLKDQHEGVRFGAALNLGRMGPEANGALPHLLAALEDPDQFVRLGVVRALGTIGPQDATVLSALNSRLHDKSAMVRRRTLDILGEIGPVALAVLPSVRAALEDGEPEVRQAAAAALDKIQRGGAGTTILPHAISAQGEKRTKKTFTYKTVETCPIKTDVYGADERARPVIIWIHGGALIMGSRGQIDKALLGKLLKAGYAVVSIDYRLGPETKLPGILEDVQDACTWVREKGPELFHADPKQIAVMGGSAGGYLTLAAGFRVKPCPKVLVSFWGYGDVAGAWYSRPDPFYSKMPAVPKEEAYQAVGHSVISETSGKNNRSRFYLYCRQRGLWPREVAGHDPDKEPKAFDPLCPIRNVSASYPPTLLIHGTKDTDVPYEQSALMAKELTRKGIDHELITVQDAGHGLAGAKPAVVADVHDRVLAFLKKYMP